ncbi:MAG: dTDP-4-dehydrorhamnose 3,5-epimerase [Sphingobacteriales bacterium]|nr:MAG: dTDP-4-dehydrorhamnose 3,5-epimerase [Sphingobacteriales bacterium]
MEIKAQQIKGVFEITFQPRGDERGYFMRTYDLNIFKEAGLHREWKQENQSRSMRKGIIRGLHFQLMPDTETKLVRCIKGTILDVYVDLREGSETFGKWGKLELSADKYNTLYIPRGFAHGFCTLEEECDVQYKVDSWYSSTNERSLLWSDAEIGIEWPVKDPILSVKDRQGMSFTEFKQKYGAIKV